MRKITSILLVCVLMTSLVACTNNALIGTWEISKVKMMGIEMDYKEFVDVAGMPFGGTFTFTDKEVTLKETDKEVTRPYKLENGNIVIEPKEGQEPQPFTMKLEKNQLILTLPNPNAPEVVFIFEKQ